MSNNRLKRGNQVRNTKEGTKQPERIKVDHGNASLITAGLLSDIRDILKRLEAKIND